MIRSPLPVTPRFAEGDFSSEHDVKAFIISMNIRRGGPDALELASLVAGEDGGGFAIQAPE